MLEKWGYYTSGQRPFTWTTSGDCALEVYTEDLSGSGADSTLGYV